MTRPAAPDEDRKRLAIVAPSVAGVVRDRALLIEEARRRGHPVLVLAPSNLAGEIAALHALGAEHRNFDPAPPGFALLSRHRLTVALRDILSGWRPDAVLVSSRGLASVAATAARKAGARRITTLVNDLGIEPEDERRRRALAYRRAAKLSAAILTHNEADLETITAALPASAKLARVANGGTGVDVRAHASLAMPGSGGPLIFLMIADPDEREAIAAYAAAAREMAKRGVPAVFRLATDREAAHDPSILTVGGVEFLGKAADAWALLTAVHVAVHLSADDGAPTALREALAAGRPVLTLDAPGCREMVDERVNGCRIPPRDPEALLAAMSSFIAHRDLLPSEGRASRAKAERAFDTGPAVATYLDALGL